MKNKKIIFWVGILSIMIVIIAAILFLSEFALKINKDIGGNKPQISEIKETDIPIKTYNDCAKLWPIEICGMYMPAERVKLYDICSKIEIPKTELDTSVYPNNKIAVIRWWNNKFQQNITMYLPYEPETKFSGCSESAKTILLDIQANEIK